MSLAQVIKTELYKNSRRKSSLMLFIPMLLAIVVTFGYAHGVIELNLITGDTGIYSCMDFVFVVWNVLSGHHRIIAHFCLRHSNSQGRLNVVRLN